MTALRCLFSVFVCMVPLAGISAPAPAAPPGMIHIPGGDYKPLYAKEAKPRKTPPYFLATAPVTNGEFLAFVKEHPEWQRSEVPREMADLNYLRHWAGDLEIGPESAKQQDAPVTYVSWFAARAYCAARGQRLAP